MENKVTIQTEHSSNLIKLVALFPFIFALMALPLFVVDNLLGQILFPFFLILTLVALTLKIEVQIDPVARELISIYSVAFLFKQKKNESLHSYKHIAVVPSLKLDPIMFTPLFYTVSLTHHQETSDSLYGSECKNMAIRHFYHGEDKANQFAFTLSIQLGIDYHGKVVL